MFEKRDNMTTEAFHLLPVHIQAIEDALAKGWRVEIVLTKQGMKIYTVKRKEVKTDS